MSSSENFREENAFSGESESLTSFESINIDDYIERDSKPEVTITRIRRGSPRIADLPEDQRPQHVREALEYSFGFQYVEGEWSCDDIKFNYSWAKIEKLRKQYNLNPELAILAPTEFNRP